MIDLKRLREEPGRYREGAAAKQMTVDIDRALELDARRRQLLTRQETLRAEQKSLAKESGPKIGKLMGRLKSAQGDERAAIEAEADQLRAKPAALKDEIASLDAELERVGPEPAPL